MNEHATGDTREHWLTLATALAQAPVGMEFPLSWYGPNTAPNEPWMHDKLRRLGVENYEIICRGQRGHKETVIRRTA